MALGSFSAALSGLNANSIYLSVIGNNLANLNTIGFKASSVTFRDLVSHTLRTSGGSGNPMQIGLGVGPGTVSPVFSQGAIQPTQEGLNVAIQGDGFLVVGTPTGFAYTRAGDFSVDSTGRLVNSSGNPVQGWTTLDPATGNIVTTGPPGNILVQPGVLRPPTPTTQFQTVSNLDAGAPVGATFGTSVQIVDTLGAAHTATITYTNTAPGAWTS